VLAASACGSPRWSDLGSWCCSVNFVD